MNASLAGAAPKRVGSLLLVDDEPDNLDLLEGMLARTKHQTTRAENGRIALDMLLAEPERFDAVLLDRMMPEMDGIAVLQKMKADPRLERIPVILQTAAGNTQQISEGLAAGAYYYLVKPFDRAQLLPIVEGAISNHQQMREMRTKLSEANPLGMIVSGRFRFKTLDEARELAAWLARANGDPGPVAYGLHELLINAVEHGNLGLGYKAKCAALKAGRLDDELAQRAADPVLGNRHVTVDVARDEQTVTYTIYDEGDGFDYHQFERADSNRLLDPNGRGIMIARDLSFDEVVYLGNGNTVRATVELGAWQEL